MKRQFFNRFYALVVLSLVHLVPLGLDAQFITLGRPADPNKGSSDGSWTGHAPDIVGSTTYPYLQYQFLSSNTAMQLKLRIEKLSSSSELKLQSANTLLDLDRDGVPEFALVLQVTAKPAFNDTDAADFNPVTGIVVDSTTHYTYQAYFLPLDDDGTADANTRPNNTTINSANATRFMIYDSGADESDDATSASQSGNAYSSSLVIRYALAPETDIDSDTTTENYFTLQFNLLAYTRFATLMASETGVQATSSTWPTSTQFYAATVSATQDNSVNGDIGGGAFDGTETWAEIQGSNAEINVKGNSTSIADGDSTPSSGDHTDFGDVDISGGSVTRTFTIENTGNGTLTLGSNAVTLTGTGYSIVSQPATTVSASGTTTFQIKFDPSVTGTAAGTISIANDDSDEAPYNYSITGNGISTTTPEINLKGNSVSIVDGDTTPDSGDHTDFGSADIATGSVARTFTIENTGSGSLDLTSTPNVSLSGTGASHFTVTTQPASDPVSASGSTTFIVTYDPSATGTHSVTVLINNDDADEGTYVLRAELRS